MSQDETAFESIDILSEKVLAHEDRTVALLLNRMIDAGERKDPFCLGTDQEVFLATSLGVIGYFYVCNLHYREEADE